MLGSNLGQASKFTVVIPAFNAGAQLPSCLAALQGSNFRDFEVLVVDDCSSDNTEEVIGSHGVGYMRTPRQLGPAGARNLGADHAHGRVLVFVDADVAVSPDTLQMIADDFERDPDLAAVFGSYDRAPADPGFSLSSRTWPTTSYTRLQIPRPGHSGRAVEPFGPKFFGAIVSMPGISAPQY